MAADAEWQYAGVLEMPHVPVMVRHWLKPRLEPANGAEKHPRSPAFCVLSPIWRGPKTKARLIFGNMHFSRPSLGAGKPAGGDPIPLPHEVSRC